MYCVKDYAANQYPETNQEVFEDLHRQAKTKYNVQGTERLLASNCNYQELAADVKCRRNQLDNLVVLWSHFPEATRPREYIAMAENMSNNLLDGIQNIE